MLEDEDIDSDSDFEEEIVCALTRPSMFTDPSEFPAPSANPAPQKPKSFADPNLFQAIADSDDSNVFDPDALDHLNNWAFKVSRKSSPKSKPVIVPKSTGNHFVKCEKDLDQLLKAHPHIAAIPGSAKKIRTVLRSMPPELVCEDDEVLCLVDSGSTVNAAWISKHFPQWAHIVRSTPASERGDSATTACGKQLVNKGRVQIKATAQGADFSVAFKDMETELPILSVRKIVKKNNDVRFRQDGGTIRNRTSGREVRFYQHEGVYFLKL